MQRWQCLIYNCTFELNIDWNKNVEDTFAEKTQMKINSLKYH